MAQLSKARVLVSECDAQGGDLLLSQAPATWEEVYEALDQAGFGEDFMVDRAQGLQRPGKSFKTSILG